MDRSIVSEHQTGRSQSLMLSKQGNGGETEFGMASEHLSHHHKEMVRREFRKVKTLDERRRRGGMDEEGQQEEAKGEVERVL